jgi:hypothetical protein
MTTPPTVGRIVHYKSYGTPGGEFEPACRAAVVTEVEGKRPVDANVYVSLAVLNPSGLFFDQDIPQAESPHRGGTWHWPCVRTETAPIHWTGTGGIPHAVKSLDGNIHGTDVPARVTCELCRDAMDRDR